MSKEQAEEMVTFVQNTKLWNICNQATGINVIVGYALEEIFIHSIMKNQALLEKAGFQNCMDGRNAHCSGSKFLNLVRISE